MSHAKLLAATAALAMSLSPLTFAGTPGNSDAHAQAIALQDAADGGLSSITVHRTGRFDDYTGMAPSMIGAGGPQWSDAMAHDYTGEAPAPSAAMLAAVPTWNFSMAHDYTGD